MIQKLFSHHGKKGFTLIELMVAITILTLISMGSARIYMNYLTSSRDLKAANLVYQEARYLMERLVREVRQGAIDYEQYWNQNVNINLPLNDGDAYTGNYCEYGMFFTDSGSDGDPRTFDDNESTGLRNDEILSEINTEGLDPAAIRAIENELYLINISGDQRTILTRIEKDVSGDTIGKVAIMQMTGEDFGSDGINAADPKGSGPDPLCAPDERENDGLPDTWHCAPGYPCKTDVILSGSGLCEGYGHLVLNDPTNANHSFIDFSPNALNVTDLRFIIAPADDPWKAYNMDTIQFQPHVTIQMTVEANPKLVDLSSGSHIPNITLTTTVTTRNYDEIKSPCQP